MTENTERLKKASTTLATMLDYLGLNASVKAEEKNGKFIMSTSSDDAGRIIGKKGQSLQSLELLLNRMATKNDIDCPWITIDVDGYSCSGNYRGNSRSKYNPGTSGKPSNDTRPRTGGGPRRRYNDEDSEKVTKLALDAAKEVKRWGEPVSLKPMNSHDRRLIHMTLKEDNEVQTESSSVQGSDRLKTIVVSPKDKA